MTRLRRGGIQKSRTVGGQQKNQDPAYERQSPKIGRDDAKVNPYGEGTRDNHDDTHLAHVSEERGRGVAIEHSLPSGVRNSTPYRYALSAHLDRTHGHHLPPREHHCHASLNHGRDKNLRLYGGCHRC